MKQARITAYIGIGSNLGDRRAYICSAIRRIAKLQDTEVIRASKIIETEPVGGPKDQPKFLNAALKIRTRLSPLALLAGFKKIEKELGRVKTVRFGPRVIDLDILLYQDRIIKRRDLTVPHPRMFEREFVIRPLLEII